MAQFDAILWDIDGTLLTGRGLGRESTRRAMLDVFGVTGDLENHHFGGKTDFQTLLLLLEPHGYTYADVASHMERFAQSISSHMAQLAPQFDVVSISGAPELLDALTQRNGLLHGIVTGNVAPSAPVKLAAAGYDPALFTFGAYGHESPNRNDLPPRAIARASALAGRAIDPARVLVIGDTRLDILAARAAGAQVCAVTTGSDTRAALAAEEPDYLLDSLTQFLDAVPMD